MKNSKLVFSLALLLILFLGCQSENESDQQQSVVEFQENFGQSVSRDFMGYIVDTNNNPLQNVTVSIGTSTVQTDVNGVFIINGASVFEKFAYITAKKSGYIDGSRAMIPTLGKNNVRIMLLSNAPIATIASGTATEVALNADTKVNFDGAFQDANGNPYSGNISVSVYHLKPSNTNLDKLMPGMLYGATENGEEAILETYGMLNVELKGASGQRLQIANGHTAQITMQIDNSQSSVAPSTIPLWHFDEENGYWIKEGSASKVGNKYVGSVSHFSWWNCDAFSSAVSLTARIVDVNQVPIANLKVRLVNNSNGTNSALQVTNNDGLVSGLIPSNEPMSLKVYDYCGNVIYTSQIGAFSNDTVLTNIVVPAISTQLSRVYGSVKQCDNSNIENGYVLAKYFDSTFIMPLTSGEFSFTTLVCSSSNSFTIEAYDYENSQGTGEISYTFSFPETKIDNLKACNTITEFISYTVGDNNFAFVTEGIDVQMPAVLGGPINMGNGGDPVQLYVGYNFHQPNTLNLPALGLYATATNVGNYTLQNSKIFLRGNFDNMPNGAMSYLQFAQPIAYNISYYSFQVNKFGPIGDYIDISFNATMTYYAQGQQVYNKTLKGIAHVIRDN